MAHGAGKLPFRHLADAEYPLALRTAFKEWSEDIGYPVGQGAGKFDPY
jgi:hypothetical protein